MSRRPLAAALLASCVLSHASAGAPPVGPAPTPVSFRHLSSKAGDLPPPNGGKQQTSSVVFDADRDGVNDFAVTERTAAPAVVLYRRRGAGWTKSVLEKGALAIEAGSYAFDVDRDGDLDLIAGGDSKSSEVWWWENPHPRHDAGTPWRRRAIKASGKTKHHDQIAGDFDGDGRLDVLFWNQGGTALVWASAPPDPRATDRPWELTTVYEWSADSEPQQRNHGGAPSWKRPNEHEGFALADIDGDGRTDIVGGGWWFKVTGPRKLQPHPVDPSYTFTRAAAGQLVEGGRPEIVLSVGDGAGPVVMYEWRRGTWVSKIILDKVQDGHSTAVADIDGDGKLDVFVAEMRIGGKNPQSRMYFLLGDGQGGFGTTVAATGHDWHEAKLADLDGDGDLDVLGKPYDFETPHVEIWLNAGRAAAGPKAAAGRAAGRE
jgi:hypothetical protein